MTPVNVSSRPLNRRLWGLGAVCLLMAIGSRLTYALRPWDPDGAIFIYMGKLVAEGGVFWRDIVDNKLPTVGFLTSSAWRLLGDWWLGYVLLQTLLAIIAALALARAARWAARARAWWPTALFALVYLNLNTVVFGGFQLETLHAFFASLGAMSAIHLLCALSEHTTGRCAPAGVPAARLRGHAALAGGQYGLFLDAMTLGLCAGCAALAKPTGLSILAALAVVLLIHLPRVMSLLLIGAGVLVGLGTVAGVVLIYLHTTGALAYLPAAWEQIQLYAANSATDLRDLNKLVWAGGVVGFPLLARWWVGRRQALCHAAPASEPATAAPLQGGPDAQADSTARTAPARGVFIFAWLWLGMELLGVILQKRMYGYHFLVLAPPAALIYGMLRRPVTLRDLGITLAPALLLSLLGIGQVLYWAGQYQRPLESGQWLLAHAHPHDRVWRDMTSRLLIETGLRPGSRYLLTFLFINADEAPQRYWAEMKRDFETLRPRWMVLPRDLPAYLEDTVTVVAELQRLPRRRENYLRAWSELETYIHTHYRLAATLERETIWERR